MKPSPIIAIFCLLAILPGSNWASGQEKSFGDGTLPEIIEVYDLDKSGDLSSEEIQAMREARRDARNNGRNAILTEFDLNNNGKLDESEKEAAQEALAQRIVDKRTQYFHNADADESGSISMEEFLTIPSIAKLAERRPQVIAPIFSKLDRNNNDLIELNEFLARLRNPRNPN